jgi:hypothetical protein
LQQCTCFVQPTKLENKEWKQEGESKKRAMIYVRKNPSRSSTQKNFKAQKYQNAETT